MRITHQPVAVWLTNGTPTRLVWEGRRYRVNDTPTRLEDPMAGWWHAAIAQPQQHRDGWRFQAIGPDGSALMFEVERVAGGWELLRVYE